METTAETPEFVAAGGLLGPHDDFSQENAPPEPDPGNLVSEEESDND